MPRFFTSAVQFDEAASVGSAVIDGEDGRHIARSLRMHTGDALTLSDGAGTDYTGEIESITGDTVMVRLTDKFKNISSAPRKLFRYSSSQSAIWLSKWLVGSSRISRLIFSSMSMHRRRRLCSPPERAATGLNTSSPRNRKAAS